MWLAERGGVEPHTHKVPNAFQACPVPYRITLQVCDYRGLTGPVLGSSLSHCGERRTRIPSLAAPSGFEPAPVPDWFTRLKRLLTRSGGSRTRNLLFLAWIRRCSIPLSYRLSLSNRRGRGGNRTHTPSQKGRLFSKQVPPPIGWLFQNVPCGVIKLASVLRTKKKPRLSVRGCHGETRSSSPQTAQRLGSNCSSRSAWSTLLMSCCT